LTKEQITRFKSLYRHVFNRDPVVEYLSSGDVVTQTRWDDRVTVLWLEESDTLTTSVDDVSVNYAIDEDAFCAILLICARALCDEALEVERTRIQETEMDNWLRGRNG